MVNFCSAFGCGNKYTPEKQISFFGKIGGLLHKMSTNNLKSLDINRDKTDGYFLKMFIDLDTFKQWRDLKQYFSCITNEELLMKMLNISHEFITSGGRKIQTDDTDDVSCESAKKYNASTKLHDRIVDEKFITNEDLAILALSDPKNKMNVPDPSDHGKVKAVKSQQPIKNENEVNCRYCDDDHNYEDCAVNHPIIMISDSLSLVKWKEHFSANQCENETFARISLPSCLKISTGGVESKMDLTPFTRFGPLVGSIIKEVEIHDDCDMKYIFELQLENKNIYMNIEDVSVANWMRFVRPAPTRQERNMTVVLKENCLYLVTIKLIQEGEELLYWQDTFLSSQHRKKTDKTVCGGCNMDFQHPLYYRVHCSLFHDIRYSLTIRKYHCKVCGEAVLGKENIRKHASELHNGRGAYQCQHCKKFFLRLSYLEMHKTYGCSLNPLRSKSLCDFCGRKFCQPQKLKNHIKRMHSDLQGVLKDFQCTKCMKILGSRAALQRHLKEVHEKIDDNFTCQMCGKHFQNKSNLKIHMLTHSGIKPFKCLLEVCNSAFTTKQCLQLHYKKVHNFDEESMPVIERSVSYTFQAYSGLNDGNEHSGEAEEPNKLDEKNEETNEKDLEEDIFHVASVKSPSPMVDPAPLECHIEPNIKVVTKGSKKWISQDIAADDVKDLSNFALENELDLSKNVEDQNLRKYSSICTASNASLLVEAALDSVCNDHSIDIDVEVTHNCDDDLVNNIYDLSQNNGLPEVSYNLEESQDINLISPSVNDHISVTDELENDIKAQDGGISYSALQDDNFRPKSHESQSRDENGTCRFGGSQKGTPTYQSNDHEQPTEKVADVETHLDDKIDKDRYSHEFAADLRSKFDADLDYRLRHYETNLDVELNRQRSSFDMCSTNLNARIKNPESLIQTIDTREIPDVDFRGERHFESLSLGSSEMQGLDMSTRGFQNYQSNINRYHHIYPDIERMDLRLNYTPPPPYDLVRVVSLDLTPPGRHSVDLSLRGLPLHQITNSRLLSDHSISNKHRIFDQARLLAGDMTSRINESRLIPETGSRLLPDSSTDRILAGNHLSGTQQSTLLPDDSRLLPDHSRLIDQRPLLSEGHILSSASLTQPQSLSAFTGFTGVSQTPFHTSSLGPRPHVTSPVNSGYHHPYSAYYP